MRNCQIPVGLRNFSEIVPTATTMVKQMPKFQALVPSSKTPRTSTTARVKKTSRPLLSGARSNAGSGALGHLLLNPDSAESLCAAQCQDSAASLTARAPKPPAAPRSSGGASSSRASAPSGPPTAGDSSSSSSEDEDESDGDGHAPAVAKTATKAGGARPTRTPAAPDTRSSRPTSARDARGFLGAGRGSGAAAAAPRPSPSPAASARGSSSSAEKSAASWSYEVADPLAAAAAVPGPAAAPPRALWAGAGAAPAEGADAAEAAVGTPGEEAALAPETAPPPAERSTASRLAAAAARWRGVAAASSGGCPRPPRVGDFVVHRHNDEDALEARSFAARATRVVKETVAASEIACAFLDCGLAAGRLAVRRSAYGDRWRYATPAEAVREVAAHEAEAEAEAEEEEEDDDGDDGLARAARERRRRPRRAARAPDAKRRKATAEPAAAAPPPPPPPLSDAAVHGATMPRWPVAGDRVLQRHNDADPLEEQSALCFISRQTRAGAKRREFSVVYEDCDTSNTHLALVAAKYGADWRFATDNDVAAALGGLVCADAEAACSVCQGRGDEDRLLLCDGCEAGAAHTYCLDPPLAEIPGEDEAWFCPRCAAAAPPPSASV